MKRLKRVREELNLSLSALARQAGLNVTTVCQAESGRFVPYPSQLARISVALGWKGAPEALLEELDDDSQD
jgi:transcriptional regulator with XRE-family HTH domain